MCLRHFTFLKQSNITFCPQIPYQFPRITPTPHRNKTMVPMCTKTSAEAPLVQSSKCPSHPLNHANPSPLPP